MKIAYASDVHREFHPDIPNWLPPLPSECDVMILAGDIADSRYAIDTVMRIADALPASTILFIAGNHEFYGVSIDNQIMQFRQAFADEPRIHYLENDSITIGDVRFLGCTLWSDFNVLGKDYVRPSMKEAERYIADFQMIRDKAGSSPFLPISAVQRFRESRDWMIKSLKEPTDHKTVVITHFPPCAETRHQAIPTDILTPYFQANCRGIIEKFQPDVWIYGHNHYSLDITIGKTLVTSNQLGYPEEASSIPPFNPEKCIEL